MRKRLIKTAIISFISVLALVLATAGVISLVSPRTMAKFCDGVGLKSAAVYYYRSDYERDRDIDKLADLIDAADFADDDITLALYCERFVSSSEYKGFCEERDKSKSSSSKISSYDYYCYLAVTSAYNTLDYELSADIAVKMTTNYEKNCPLSVAILTAVTDGNKAYAEKIIEKYDKYGASIKKSEELNGDLDKLKGI